MTAFLASVSNLDEAGIVLECGADIIDLKNPLQGALGALSLKQVRDIVQWVARRKPISATVGDLPMQAHVLFDAVQSMARTEVDIVKVGFFGDQPNQDCISALSVLAGQGVKLVAVMFADQGFQVSAIQPLATAGFYGVMLDTAVKNGQSLRDICTDRELGEFVQEAHRSSLLAGLAGSLRSQDISVLSAYNPDYLGFRGALCTNAQRTMQVEPQKVSAVGQLLYECNCACQNIVAMA